MWWSIYCQVLIDLLFRSWIIIWNRKIHSDKLVRIIDYEQDNKLETQKMIILKGLEINPTFVILIFARMHPKLR